MVAKRQVFVKSVLVFPFVIDLLLQQVVVIFEVIQIFIVFLL